jgi:predicted nucleic acid-binding protein
MVLVDTSVWVTHLRSGDIGLDTLLNDARVVCHQFVIGELACGNLKNRAEILALLQDLPSVTVAEHREVMWFIETHGLMAKGLGYIDMHLLASAKLAGLPLWTLDKRLKDAAFALGISYA